MLSFLAGSHLKLQNPQNSVTNWKWNLNNYIKIANAKKLDSTHPCSKLDIEKAALEYRKQRNKVTYLIRTSQKAYFSKMVTENKDTASLWKSINYLTKKSHNKQNNNYAWSPNAFNDHFLNIAESTLSNNASSNSYDIPSQLLNFCNTKLQNTSSFKIPQLGVYEVGLLISNL